MKNMLFGICVLVGAYEGLGLLKDHRIAKANEAYFASQPGTRAPSRAGFVNAFALNGIDPRVLTVLMPCGCPEDASARGWVLVEKLKAANIPVAASVNVGITLSGMSPDEMQAKMDLMNRVMNGETPIVFYKGRAKNNPSFEDVRLKYQTSQ
jgi:hypothetical protein